MLDKENDLMQFYSDPTRTQETYHLPDAEVFFLTRGEMSNDEGESLTSGYYYWYCLPGCLPDTDPCGPFVSVGAAINACREDWDN